MKATKKITPSCREDSAGCLLPALALAEIEKLGEALRQLEMYALVWRASKPRAPFPGVAARVLELRFNNAIPSLIGLMRTSRRSS